MSIFQEAKDDNCVMKLKVLILSLGLLVPTTSALASAAPSPGSKCSKSGQTKIYKQRKFTCVKAGNKTVWNKGVQVKISKPNNTQSNSSPKDPSPTLPARPDRLTLDNLDPYWTQRIAMEKVNSYLRSLNAIKDVGKIISSPKTPKEYVQTERTLLDKSVTLWSKYFMNENMKIVIFTNEDSDWADSALIEHGGSFPNKVSDEIKKQSQFNCNFGFATLADQGRTPIYYMCNDLRGRKSSDTHNTPHEYFHLVQQKLVWANGFQEFPVWLHEGSATFFGTAVGFFDDDPTGKKSLDFYKELYWQYDPDNTGVRNFERLKGVLSSISPEGAVKLYEPLEKTQTNNSNLHLFGHYALGAIATEALVAVYGFETYMEFMQDFSKRNDWKANFENRFGLSIQDFYKKLAPYLRTKA